MNPNRVVAVLTPLVFAPLAGAIATLVAQNFPGVELEASSLEQVFIAGALIALAPAAQWMRGWQKYEERESQGGELATLLAERDSELAAERSVIAAEPEEDYEDYGDEEAQPASSTR